MLLGLTVFETLRTYDGHRSARPAFGSAHGLDRTPQIKSPSRDEIEQEILSVCEGNVYVRYTLTGVAVASFIDVHR